MHDKIKSYCHNLTKEFDSIPQPRKVQLEKISQYINAKQAENKPINLIYICTHNSRRSHFGQIWANVAANYYHIKNISTFSGGTEVAQFNTNAIDALKRVGFTIEKTNSENNPVYHVYFGDTEDPSICFSKLYSDKSNPQEEFAAIMVCSEAENNCPYIPNVELRIATNYDDPKNFDGNPLQDIKYDERCKQIALETFYVFSKVK